MEASANKRASRLTRVRVTLRAFMLVVLIVGAGLGFVLIRVRDQRDAVGAIERAGGTVIYEYQWNHGDHDFLARPGWLPERLGLDLFYRVKEVSIGGAANAVDAGELMEQVGRLRDLEVLSLNGWSNVKDADLGPLERMTGLTDLDLTYTGASGRCMKLVEGLTKLKKLAVPTAPITDADLAYLKGLTALESLVILVTSPGITDRGLDQLKGLVNLSFLSVSSPGITTAGLDALRDMSRLAMLNVRDSKVADLAPIRHLTGLASLSLPSSRIDDAGLAHLGELKALTYLNLSRSRITDAGLAHVGKLTALTILILDDTAIGDAGLAQLAGLDELGALSLAGTRVTDAGLLPLQGMKLCEQVDVRRTKVTEAGLAAARQKGPGTRSTP